MYYSASANKIWINVDYATATLNGMASSYILNKTLFFSIVVDNYTIKIYFNNNLIQTISSNWKSTWQSGFGISNYYNLGNCSLGYFTHFRIYDRALLEEEITLLYEEGIIF